MNQTVVEKIKNRYEILIQNVDMETVSTSRITFFMNLCLLGNVFQPEPWMTNEYMTSIMTEAEYRDGIYDSVLNQLYDNFLEVIRQSDLSN